MPSIVGFVDFWDPAFGPFAFVFIFLDYIRNPNFKAIVKIGSPAVKSVTNIFIQRHFQLIKYSLSTIGVETGYEACTLYYQVVACFCWLR